LVGLIARVIQDLGSIVRWSTKNGLLLSPTKSQAILVSNSPPTVLLPILFLGDVALDSKDVVTDLGLLIDGRLRFGRHHQVFFLCRIYDFGFFQNSFKSAMKMQKKSSKN
jgi:hypothetical protein